LLGAIVMGPGYWELRDADDFHTGRPTPQIALTTEAPLPVVGTGAGNAPRLADFKTVDVHIARELVFDRSPPTLFSGVANVFDWNNEGSAQYDVDDEDGPLELDAESNNCLPVVASLGLVWPF
jgi:hypothetical protein